MKPITRSAIVAVILFATDAAQARPQYLREFKHEYPKLSIPEKAKCSVCHCGENKKVGNDYGEAIEVLLGARKNVRDAKVIRQALIDAEKEPSSVPKKTFGDLIRAGRLPGTCK